VPSASLTIRARMPLVEALMAAATPPRLLLVASMLIWVVPVAVVMAKTPSPTVAALLAKLVETSDWARASCSTSMVAADVLGAPLAVGRDETVTAAASLLTTLYDAGGNAVSASLFFVRQPDVDGRPQWQMSVVADGQNATATPVTLDFGADGNLTSPLGAIQLDAITPSSGAAAFAPQLQIGSATSLATGSFTVRNLTHDGVAIARFADMAIGLDGTVSASFSDGSSRVLGRLLVADFTNPAGLKQLGDSRWQASADSGDPLAGIAGISGFGDVRSGLLERSNVELTEELVALIAAQRNFQANAKAIDAANQLSQTIINLRS
jgi:flagellar hook protein FlgE